ncbi:MAG: YihY/virulence factor BrkB family protein [Lachnospiraceae bacterium]|nr:YihY/virulence factor BrkB family protein [Lachnospiraceae bacterium]
MKKIFDNKYVLYIIRTLQDLDKKDIGVYASSTTFFFFIALIPLLMFLLKLLPLTGIDKDGFLYFLALYMPSFTTTIMGAIVEQAYSSANGLFPFYAIVLLYSSARAMLSLLMGLDRIYDVKERRNGLLMQILAIFYTIVFVVLMAVFMLVIVFGNEIMDFLMRHLIILKSILTVFSMRYLLLFLLGVLIFMLMYTFLPRERQQFTHQLPGAVFAALAWVIFSFIFSLFIDSSIYSTFYGGLATVTIFLVWLNGCFYILLIGAGLNHSLTVNGLL